MKHTVNTLSKQNIELTRAWRNPFIPFPINRESVYFHMLHLNVTFAYEFTQNHKTRHDVQILAILSLRDFPVPLIYIFFFTLLTFYSRDIVMRVTSFYTVIKFGFEIIGSQPLFKSRSLCSIFHLFPPVFIPYHIRALLAQRGSRICNSNLVWVIKEY